MNKPLLLFVGKSASGKTTIANKLCEQYNKKQVESYTTRQPRYENEIGHKFISKEEFKKLPELAAYTYYNGNDYGTTFEQLKECDIYVIDVPGVETLLKNYNKINRAILIFYFDSPVPTRIDRMKKRKDSDSDILSRLYHDEQTNWFLDLKKCVEENNILSVCLISIDAKKEINEIINLITYWTEFYVGEIL